MFALSAASVPVPWRSVLTVSSWSFLTTADKTTVVCACCRRQTRVSSGARRRLQLPAVSDRPTSGLGFSRVKRLHFGATGAHLCAITHEGLHLWRRGAQREDWRPAGWVNEEDTAGARYGLSGLGGLFLGGGAGGGGVPGGQLSPDGSHCVLFGDRRGRCSVWGPDHSGRYRKKVSIEPGRCLYKVQFTPDGSQLLLAFEGDFVSQGRRAHRVWPALTLVPEPDSANATETGSGAQPPQTDAGFQTAERTLQQAL